MADSGVLKEFLYSVGFKVDNNSITKFRAATGKADKAVKGADKSLVGAAKSLKGFQDALKVVAESAAAAAFVATVEKVATGLDNLYWQSIRTRASVENIKALSYGLSQVGGTAAGAASALENFSESLKSNPGLEGMLRGMGVQTRNAKGGMRDAAETLQSFGQYLKTQPYYVAKQYAAMFGIDPITLQALMRDSKPYRDQAKEFYRSIGFDADKAAESANQFKIAQRQMFFEIGAFVEKEGGDFIGWLVDVGKSYSGEFAQISDDATKLGAALTALAADFPGLGDAMHAAFGEVLRMFDALLNMITHVALAMDAVAHRDWGRAEREAALAVTTSPAAVLAGDAARVVTGAQGGGGSSKGGWSGGWGGSGGGGGLGGPASAGRGSRAERNNNPGNIMSGSHYNHYATMALGYAAMVHQILIDYNKHGQRTVRSLINDPHHGWSNEWSPGNKHAAIANYIASVSRSMGIGPDQQFGADPSSLARLMVGMNSFEAGHKTPNALALATQGVILNQKTDIHVYSSADAAGTAKHVASNQDRVNGDMVRNLKGVVQ